MRGRVHPADHLLLLTPDLELTPGQFAHVEAHLATCASCRDRRARLLHVAAAGPNDDAPRSDTNASAHATARTRLRAVLRREAVHRPAAWRSPLAVAATVVLAALALQLPLQRHIDVDATGEEAHALPVPVFTPGAVSDLNAPALCAGERPSRLVSGAARDQVLAEYQMQRAPDAAYELDALITPELGGTTARANLWPQPYDTVWNAHVKDALESLLSDQVCSGAMPLRVAQQELADNWIAAYKRHFDTALPRTGHLASLEFDQELVVIEPLRPGGRPRVFATGSRTQVGLVHGPAAPAAWRLEWQSAGRNGRV